MRPKLTAAGVAGFVAASLLLALSASAAGATTYYYVDAPAAEGLSFSASGPVKPGRSKRITAGFSTRGLRAFTLYSARSSSRATRRRIRARIPRLGHVAVRFHERRTRRNVVHADAPRSREASKTRGSQGVVA